MALHRFEVAVTHEVVEYITLDVEAIDEEYAEEALDERMRTLMEDYQAMNAKVVSSDYEILDYRRVSLREVEAELAS